MVRGVFGSYCHDHYFETHANETLMKDVVELSAPWGVLGRVAERLVVGKHMRKLLEHRNAFIKHCAESSDWMKFLRG